MWSELLFTVAGEDVERWSDALLEAGALSVQAEDADADSPDEQAIFGEPGEPVPVAAWARTRLRVLVDAQCDPDALMSAAAQACVLAPPSYGVTAVADQDWVRLTQSQFDPIPVGARLTIVPSWHLESERARAAGAELIMLDPGLAFGTGSHPTTRMCLEWLDAHVTAGQSLIDYGCGSGILAIAAARLGASPVTAIDIDPQALVSTRDNAQANRVDLQVLAALLAATRRRTLIFTVLAGFATGLGVMEGFDTGAILSLIVAAFAIWLAWVTGQGATGARLAKGVGSVAVVAVFAGFIATYTLITLISTQVKGIVGMEQDKASKERRYVEATIWSLPKIETLRVVIPGLFGYRMDTPDGGAYWGSIGENPNLAQIREIAGKGDPQAKDALRNPTLYRHSGSGE